MSFPAWEHLRRLATRGRVVWCLVVATSLLGIVAADGRRSAALAAVTAAAITATRVRFAGRAATAVLATVALLAISGQAAESDTRATPSRHRAQQDGGSSAAFRSER